MEKNRSLNWLKILLLVAVMAGGLFLLIFNLKPLKQQNTEPNSTEILYEVKSVLDGDTIKIDYNGTETSVRFIGVNTPETVDPRTTVECFGQEASNYLKELLTGKKVKIEADSSQTDRDKYDRLLRYVYLDGEDVGYKIINNGYGYEYTYDVPYSKQSAYKNAQDDASKAGRGLWAEGACVKSDTNAVEDAPEPQTEIITPIDNDSSSEANEVCNIKGNINYSGEKIYHVPGQEYYNSTEINEEYGERWFCTEEEARAAGWRKSKV